MPQSSIDQPIPPAERLPGDGPNSPWTWRLAVLVAIVAAIPFLPALQGEFLNWDDKYNFLLNKNFRGLGLTQLKWMFTTFHLGGYQPLSWLLLGVEYTIMGLDPQAYHAVSLLLHVLFAFLLFFVARRLLALALCRHFIPRPLELDVAAMLTAGLFAVHPMRVEVVAWLSCQAYLLGGVFLLLTLHTYLLAHTKGGPGKPKPGWLAWSYFLYLCALGSKATTVPLPLVLFVLDVYPLNRISASAPKRSLRRVLLEKLGFLILAVPFAVAAPLAKAGFQPTPDQLHPLARLAQSAYGLCSYLYKTVIPYPLLPLYEVPYPFDYTELRFIACGIGVAVVTVVVVAIARRCPSLPAAWFCYVLLVAPTAGIVKYSYQLTADRYTYLPSLAWFILLTGIMLWFCRRSAEQRRRRQLVVSLVMVIAVTWSGISWVYASKWQTSYSMWSHMLEYEPDSAIVHRGLGTALLERGNPRAAVEHLSKAVALPRPLGEFGRRLHFESHFNLGLAWKQLDRFEEAVAAFHRALELRPDSTEVLYNLANTELARRHPASAVEAYQRVLELDPGDLETLQNLGVAYFTVGEPRQAIDAFRRVLEADPDRVEVWVNMGIALTDVGRPDEAEQAFRRALALDPHNPRARRELNALTQP